MSTQTDNTRQSVLPPALVQEFDERFSNNLVYWQEIISEIQIAGDPDFTSLKEFMQKAYTAGREDESEGWMNQSANQHDKRIRQDEMEKLSVHAALCPNCSDWMNRISLDLRGHYAYVCDGCEKKFTLQPTPPSEEQV